MEGATGTITDLGDGWVRKTIKKKMRGKTRSAKEQLDIQVWSHGHLTPAHGYKLLYTPDARAGDSEHSFEMERIDTSEQIMKVTDEALGDEVVKYHRAGIRRGLFLNDIELYKQPDGRIAVLDFDKVGNLSGDTVTYVPSGKIQKLQDAIPQYYLTPALAERILAKRSRSRSRSRSKSRTPNKTRKN